MRLGYRLKKRQLYNYEMALTPTPYYYVENISGQLQRIMTEIPLNDWIEGYVKERNSLSFEQVVENSTIKLNVNGSVIFTGKSFEYIKDWMFKNNARKYNNIIVEVSDLDCNELIGYYLIDNSSIKYCDSKCEIDAGLVEYRPDLDCINSIAVTSNWQGWFPQNGTVGTAPANSIIAVKGEKQIYNSITSTYTYSTNAYTFPSPKVRTLIDNVCVKCGLTVNADAFNNGAGAIFTTASSPYYDTVYKIAASGSPIPNNWWNTNHNIYKTLPQLMEKILPMFNAIYYVKGNNFYHHRNRYDNGEYILNITELTTIEDSCYEGSLGTYKRGMLFEYADRGFNNEFTVIENRLFDDAIDFTDDYNINNNEAELVEIKPDYASPKVLNDKSETDSTLPLSNYGKLEVFFHIDQNEDLASLLIAENNGLLRSYPDPVPFVPNNPTSIPYDVFNDVPAQSGGKYVPYNYPYMFEPAFDNNIYTYFWHRENEKFYPKKGIYKTVVIAECCKMKSLLGLFYNNDYAVTKFVQDIDLDGTLKGFEIQKITFEDKKITITIIV